jgi:hypothetical protein
MDFNRDLAAGAAAMSASFGPKYSTILTPFPDALQSILERHESHHRSDPSLLNEFAIAPTAGARCRTTTGTDMEDLEYAMDE